MSRSARDTLPQLCGQLNERLRQANSRTTPVKLQPNPALPLYPSPASIIRGGTLANHLQPIQLTHTLANNRADLSCQPTVAGGAAQQRPLPVCVRTNDRSTAPAANWRKLGRQVSKERVIGESARATLGTADSWAGRMARSPSRLPGHRRNAKRRPGLGAGPAHRATVAPGLTSFGGAVASHQGTPRPGPGDLLAAHRHAIAQHRDDENHGHENYPEHATPPLLERHRALPLPYNSRARSGIQSPRRRSPAGRTLPILPRQFAPPKGPSYRQISRDRPPRLPRQRPDRAHLV